MVENDLQAITSVLEKARVKLLDTGSRNRLIHVNRASKRANCLNIINERADEIYSILRVQGKQMRFKAMGKDSTAESENMSLALLDVKPPDDGSQRLTDKFIETPLGPEALTRRLLRLAKDAKTAEEEQGINILYLAIGFLVWRESPRSEVRREAPLILLPVQLKRNERTSTYDILCHDDDITTNLPLKERLRLDFNISVPEVEEDESWKPSDYFEKVSEKVSNQSEWSVDANGMQLGLFSFAKFLMYRDLDAEVWPNTALSENSLFKGLLTGGFLEDEPLFGPADKLDEKLDPAEIIQVVDADASQTKVIEEARRGYNLVVQGPPGTGKSQTITNVIAGAVHDGKTVLFVAEKMAALSVVHNRLVKSGLRDICLELHSRYANKKEFYQELERTLKASAKTLPNLDEPTQLRETRDKLNCLTKVLHSPLPETGDTPYNALSELIGFIGKNAPPPKISPDGLEILNSGAREFTCKAIAKYVAALQDMDGPQSHSFRGTDELELQPTDLLRLKDELKSADNAISGLTKDAGAIARSAHQPEPMTIDEAKSLANGLGLLSEAPEGVTPFVKMLFRQEDDERLNEALEAGIKWTRAYKAAEHRFTQSAWEMDIGALIPPITQGQISLFARLFGRYRSASSELSTLLLIPLPKSPSERLKLVNEIFCVQRLRKHLGEHEAWLQSVLDVEWRGESTPFEKIKNASKWLMKIRESGTFSSASRLLQALEALENPVNAAKSIANKATACLNIMQAPISRLKLDISKAGLGMSIEEASLEAVSVKFRQMIDGINQYKKWVDYIHAKKNLEDNKAAAIIAHISLGKLGVERAEEEFLYACAEARWKAALKIRPELKELDKLDRHKLVSEFQELEKAHIKATKNLVLSGHFKQMPRGSQGAMGTIRDQIARKRRHIPVRKLMKLAGDMVLRIKPVMLMSPISVAQFLPPGKISFDLLVIDEASQVRPEDALGVIARAKQIVVVGDQKQLPPTSFFSRLIDNTEDDDDNDEYNGAKSTADMESILSLCNARCLRSRMLEWHYRSRSPSLIRVSNTEFYEDKLVLPPSSLLSNPNYGLKYFRVPGVYARSGSGLGRQGTNQIEAESVAKAVEKHAQEKPDCSLGIVAFSKAQADMLTEVLEGRRRQNPVLDIFLREGKSEDVFVKNIENVQGDERDVIFISVGYGPQKPNGRLMQMRFGPVNQEGGERRLNVLFSRARLRCEVFASFDPDDINLNRNNQSSSQGLRVFKQFLKFAKTGEMEGGGGPIGTHDSPFEEEVAKVIESFDYIADPQVGDAGFRIDLGVRHSSYRPGCYLLAVECDGAAYHSALWARERDRLRQEILENRGWRFHRIWSTDWYYNREREIEKLKNALDASKSSIDDGNYVQGANSGTSPVDIDKPEQNDDDIDGPDINHLTLEARPYVRGDYFIDIAPDIQPHDAPVNKLAQLVQKIVKTEGPIHEDEIARRVTNAFGLSKAGKRIVEATNRAISFASGSDKSLRKMGAFVLTQKQLDDPEVRDRSQESGSLLKAEYLSPIEISAAAKKITHENGEMSSEEMIQSIARLLGYQRVGPDLSKVIRKVLAR